MKEIPDHTIFYDGECGFCNKSVAYVLRNEKNNRIHFVALQSNRSKEFFNSLGLPEPDLSSVIFLRNGKLLYESTAALYLSKELKFPYNLSFAFIIIPKFIRNFFYKIIAKQRHKMFKSFCVLPSADQRARFLN